MEFDWTLKTLPRKIVMDLLDKAKNVFDWVKSARMPSPVFSAVATSDNLNNDGFISIRENARAPAYDGGPNCAE